VYVLNIIKYVFILICFYSIYTPNLNLLSTLEHNILRKRKVKSVSVCSMSMYAQTHDEESDM